MNRLEDVLLKLKPGIPKRYLLFVAAVAWTFAGGMLLFRGLTFMNFHSHMIWEKIAAAGIAGIIFYVVMFSKISAKHIRRIVNLKQEKPCAFSFFDWRSYGLMSIMITSGVLIRLSGIVPVNYLSEFYITMGTPLFISAFRFYIHGFTFSTSNSINN
jgi:hypothetical protein